MRSYEFFNDRYFVQPVRTRWLDRLFMHSHTWEIDGANRFCPGTLVVRFFPLPIGLAFGRWEDSGTLNYELRTLGEYNSEYDAYCEIYGDLNYDEWLALRDAARLIIEEQGMDPNSEEEIMQMLGLLDNQ